MYIAKTKIKILIFFLAVVGLLAVVVSVRAVNNSIFSVSVWVNPTTSVASRAIMGKAEEMRVATDATGHPLCQIRATTWQTAVVSSQVITVNQWAHVVCTYDRVNFKIFINGELKGTQALTAIADDTAALWQLGRDASASSPYGNFTGLIDAYKFYTYALSDDEIKTLYNGGSSLLMGGESATANNNGTTVSGDNAKYCVPGDTAKCDKPVLELKMDEKSGTTAFDTSGNGNNGTLTGGPVWDRGKNGSALRFDGVDDYVGLTDGNILFTPYDDAYSVEFWVKGNPGTNEALMTESVNNSTGPLFGIYKSNDKLKVKVRNSVPAYILDKDSTAVVFNNQWHHVFWKDYQGVGELYIDGKKDLTNFSYVKSNSLSGMNRVTWGSIRYNSTNINYLNGQIDDVRVYNYLRTPAQIAWDYNRGKPVAEWRFDENSGTTVHDESGNGNSGTMTNMDAGTDWVEGKFGKALDFDGEDDYINIDSITNSFNNKKGSFSAWVKRDFADTVSEDKYVFHIFYNNGNYHEIKYNNTNDQWKFNVNRAYTLNSVVKTPSTIPQNVWTHVLMTWDEDGNDVSVFINGINVGSASSGGSYIVTPTTGRIGAARTNMYEFDGLIDDVRVYNYALTEEQVKSTYNSGAVNFE